MVASSPSDIPSPSFPLFSSSLPPFLPSFLPFLFHLNPPSGEGVAEASSPGCQHVLSEPLLPQQQLWIHTSYCPISAFRETPSWYLGPPLKVLHCRSLTEQAPLPSPEVCSRVGQWRPCPLSWSGSEGGQPLPRTPGSPASTQGSTDPICWS